MPWSEDHKQKTRERIVAAAASIFRQQGIEQTTVAEVMQRAGLTHGGFYAHFSSKDDLVADAIVHASDQLRDVFPSADSGVTSSNPILTAAEKYLSHGHLAHPELGCPLAALSSELIRGNQKVRKALGTEIRKRLDALYHWTASRLSPARRRQQAAGALACMVGGMILARSLKEPEATALLQDCQSFLESALRTPTRRTRQATNRDQ